MGLGLFAPANAVPVAGTAFNATAAGIGAVVGALLAGKKAYDLCGGAETRNNLERLFSQGKAPVELIEQSEKDMRSRYGVTDKEARFLSKVAMVGASHGITGTPNSCLSPEAEKIAVLGLLRRANHA